MTPLDIDTVMGWRGRTVRDVDGDKVGTFGDVFLDQETDRPAWGGVRTGLFGRHESFVPLSVVREEGDDLLIPFAADQVKGAPRVDPDVALTTEEERALYTHYGQDYGEPRSGDEDGAEAQTGAAGGPPASDEDGAEAQTGAVAAGGPAAGDERRDDTAERAGEAEGRPLGEGEMIRSEEEVRVREGPMRPKERVRLRKVLVTEHVQQTVPVQKEVVALETDPPPEGVDAEADADAPGRDRSTESEGSPPA